MIHLSKKERSIASYSICLIDKKTEDMYEEENISEVLNNLLRYILSIKDLKNRRLEKKSENKIYYLEDIVTDSEVDEIQYLKFVSAKYNHIPDLINTQTLQAKTNNKTPIDGDKEYTHVGLLYKENEVIMIHEQRLNGTSKSIINQYLKKYFKEYLQKINKTVKYKFAIDMIPDKNFVEELASLKRINMATFLVSKSKIKAKAFQRFAGRKNVQQFAEISFKAEKSKSINNNDILDAYNNRESENVNRIIVRGFNKEGRIKLDTEPIKTINKISVELTVNGIVKDDSIEEEFKKLLKGMI